MVQKIQIAPDDFAFKNDVVRRLNSFSEVNASFGSANIAATFSHGLGKPPQHAILRLSNKPVSVYATAADQLLWTRTQVVLRANNSNVTCVVKLE